MAEHNQQDAINKLSPEEAVAILWRKGNLRFKLDKNQNELVDSYHNAFNKLVVWACSRRLGKSRTLCVLAIEVCLQKKNAIVKYLAPKQKAAKSIIQPLMRELVADAPEDIRPIEKASAGIWYFPSTGSQIQIAGCDGGRAEAVRGGSADLCIVDEAGFVSKDLDYIVNSILLPTTTTTNGKIILSSTPPPSIDHAFVKFVNKARSEKSYIKKTIWDNPRLTFQQVKEMADAVGGMDSINFRREFLVEFITDTERAIVPEFTKELKDKIVKEWTKPAFYDTYVAMDVGLKDLTVVLFAYYDFKAGKLIIEDEFVINGQKFTTTTLAEGIKFKEGIHFTSQLTGELLEPYKRVSDNNLILIQDLYRLHGLSFHPTKKDHAEAALNDMRILIKEEKIIINPRCETLIFHLETGLWNKNKTSFDRTFDGFHYDSIDSLKYLVRNVDFHHNPFPRGFGMMRGPDAYNLNNSKKSPAMEAIKKIMNIKPR